MRPEIKYSLPVDSDTAIVQIRSSLLILAQTGEVSDLSSARHALSNLREQADNDRRPKISAAISECEAALEDLARETHPLPSSVFKVLDKIASIEAAMLDTSLHSSDFLDDLTSLVDVSFDGLSPKPVEDTVSNEELPERFEIDEETLEIFRNEASDLLSAIDTSLNVLLESPSNSNAIWEIRRNAHTFKGAAGIVGFKNACRIAHRMEDLLDAVVSSRSGAGPPVNDFLLSAVGSLHSILEEKAVDDNVKEFKELYSKAVAWLSDRVAGDTSTSGNAGHPEQLPSPTDRTVSPEKFAARPSPVVRVSIERIDFLMQLTGKVTANGSELARLLSERSNSLLADPASNGQIESLLAAAGEMHRKLQVELGRIRMVRFATIETRLSRAINTTCGDVNKKASLRLVNGEAEIDTLVIDALIEPLIHLLKNAVVHGIETPETRRLIGKSETGLITVEIEAGSEAVILSVSDDGGGISLARLKDRAVAGGIIDPSQLTTLSDRDALKLIFAKGLSTSHSLDLNAGRGVGMAIVKESVESRGGSVLIDSQIQKGTTFTILMPLTVPVFDPPPSDDIQPEQVPTEGLDPLVLIVDDSASIRNQAVKIVENAGFRTITANNGAEALELLLSGRWEPDLILSDVEMPQIDGWQFLEYVKTDENFGGIPVVMVTSLDLPKYRKRAYDLGASDYIVKPVTTTDLERVCKEYASRA